MRRWALMVLLAGVLLTPVRAQNGGAPVVAVPGGLCPLFPPDNIWNTPVDDLPLDPRSSSYVASIGAAGGLKMDFGSGLWNGGPIGIPFDTVSAGQARVPVGFDFASESDAGPYPIPPGAQIEGGAQSDGDRHILVVEAGACTLFETWNTWPDGSGGWLAGSGAVFDLRSHTLRPDGWTSADAAGLPILPGLVREDEVAAGEIRHALRFTAPRTRRASVWPARHFASTSTDPTLPPMGQRFRLRKDFDISGFSPRNQVILRALQRYGMLLADNGSAWYVSGAPSERWNTNELRQLLTGVHGSDFEAVDSSALMLSPDSGQIRPRAVTPVPTPVALPTSKRPAIGR